MLKLYPDKKEVLMVSRRLGLGLGELTVLNGVGIWINTACSTWDWTKKKLETAIGSECCSQIADGYHSKRAYYFHFVGFTLASDLFRHPIKCAG